MGYNDSTQLPLAWLDKPAVAGFTKTSFYFLFRIEVIDRQSFLGLPNLLLGLLVLLAFHVTGLHRKRTTEHKNFVGLGGQRRRILRPAR